MDTFLNTVAKKNLWQRPDYRTLSGKQKGIGELRWKSDGIPHRVIGYAIGDHHFLVLICCTHDGSKYDPSDCLESAAKRKKKIERGEARYVEYKLITGK
jgi:hypothetical protein